MFITEKAIYAQQRMRKLVTSETAPRFTIKHVASADVAYNNKSAIVASIVYNIMKKKVVEKVTLEEEEKEHERILRDCKLTVDPNITLQFPASLSLSMPEPESETPDFDEMLSVAIEREVRSREIYENAADLVSGNFKELLTGLAHFEREHEEKLRHLKSPA